MQEAKDAKWERGLDLRVRRAKDAGFDRAKALAVDLFLDPNAGSHFYLTEEGNLAVMPAVKLGKAEPPDFLHGFTLRCRRAEIFELDDHVFGVELYRHRDAAALLYVNEAGAVCSSGREKDRRRQGQEARMALRANASLPAS